MMKKMLLAASGLLAFLPAMPAAAQNIVTNGNFENPGAPLAGWTTNWGSRTDSPLQGTTSATTGCVGTACIRDNAGNFQQTGSGAYLSQNLTTVVGGSYTLSFLFRSDGNPNELAALFGNTVAFDGVNLPSTSQGYTVSGLVANSAITELRFLGRQDPGFNWIDSISITLDSTNGAVPEPATWGLMIAGFGLVGAAMRRRSTKVAFA